MSSRSKAARLLTARSASGLKEYPLNDETLIGSAPGNDLVLDGAGVSRRHALVRRTDGGFELSDLGSTNGTFVNGRRIDSGVRLKQGDRIEMGGQKLTFVDSAVSTDEAGTTVRRRLTQVIAGAIGLFIVSFMSVEYMMHHRRPAPGAKTVTGSKAAATGSATGAEKRFKVASATALGTGFLLAPGKPAPLARDAGWLARVNYYRVVAGERPVAEDPERSAADRDHSKYLVMADAGEIAAGRNLGVMAHREDPAARWYTAAGSRAGRTSDVYYGRGAARVSALVDGWLAGPFHRLAMLEPALGRVGFGIYQRNGLYAAALELVPPLAPSHVYTRAVAFPPAGATVELAAVGGEWPDPLASCPGYAEPTGLPVTLQVGSSVRPHLAAHSITLDGRPVEHCAFDADSYTNPDASVQSYARNILLGYGAVVLIPRRPLVAGSVYRVSIVALGRSYRWSFIAGAARPKPIEESAGLR